MLTRIFPLYQGKPLSLFHSIIKRANDGITLIVLAYPIFFFYTFKDTIQAMSSKSVNPSKKWTGLKLLFTKREHFVQVRIQSSCRRHFQCGSHDGISFWWIRKHSGKKRKYCQVAFSPFQNMFSNVCFARDVKTVVCVKMLSGCKRATWPFVTPSKGVLTLSQTTSAFYIPRIEGFWKHCETRRKCWWLGIFSFSQQCFLTNKGQILFLAPRLFCRLHMVSNWIDPKFCRLEKS